MVLDFTVFLLRFFLSFIFFIAGFSKWRNRVTTKKNVVDFGLPIFFAKPVAYLLPITEVIVAITLLFPLTFFGSAIVSIFLLLIFSTLIIFTISKNNKITCNCFGTLNQTPIGWNTIYRNIVLLLISFTIVTKGNTSNNVSFEDWTENHWIIFILLCFVLIQSIVNTHLLNEKEINKLRLTKLEKKIFKGLTIGTKAPDFLFFNPEGQQMDLNTLVTIEKPLILFFFNPTCALCDMFLPKAILLHQKYKDQVSMVFISPEGKKTKQLSEIKDLIFLIPNTEDFAYKIYRLYGLPSAIYITPKGKIGSFPAHGETAITELIEQYAT